MNSIIFVLFLIISQSNQDVIQKIINGRECKPGEFPSIVSLNFVVTGKHFCGGTIIDDKHVLTAAHCFQLIPILPIHAMLVKIIAGDIFAPKQTNANPVRQKIPLTKIEIHPEYDKQTYKNDIALLTLADSLRLSKLANVIPMAGTKPKIGTKCITAGWGNTKENGTFSEILLATDLTIQEMEKCNFNISNSSFKVDDTQICAGDLLGEHDSCQGDSGGPLYCNNELSGIVSYGKGCARKDSPGVYTYVGYHKDWIQESIKEKGIFDTVPIHKIPQAVESIQSWLNSAISVNQSQLLCWLIALVVVYSV